MKPIILFCAGAQGEKIFNMYPSGTVAYFCDNLKYGNTKLGIPIISFDELRRIHKDYRVIVALEFAAPTLDVCKQLKNDGIPYESFFVLQHCMHVYYDEVEWRFEYDDVLIAEWSRKRLQHGTIPMMKDLFNRYGDYLIQSNADFFVYAGDYASEADESRHILGKDKIYSYSTLYALSDRVIPIPDYKFYYSGYNGDSDMVDCDSLFNQLRENGNKPWVDERAFWGGNLSNAEARYQLMAMAEKYPEKLKVAAFYDTAHGFSYGKENFVRMQDFVDYKYLIDIRGWGWTDRVKLLLAMGRPLLLVNRPFSEYYFPYLEPMKHYVPVKEDLSDLIEKIDLLNDNPQLYTDIVSNAQTFTCRYFSKDKVLEDFYKTLVSL